MTNGGGGGDRVTLVVGTTAAYDGGAGLDTAAVAARHDKVALAKVGDTWQVTDASTGKVSALSNVERLAFADVTVALDTDGVAGQAFRLYQAAFDRAPDMAGLGLWIGKLDQGATLSSVARSFIASAEFTTLMGTATPTDEAFVTAMYRNVLHREPDAPGMKFWLDQLKAGMARETVLTGFSESTENQVAVADDTAHGIAYVPYTATSVGTGGSDRVTLSTAAPFKFDGGSGQDTAVIGADRDNFALKKSASGWDMVDAATGSVSTVSNVERVAFADVTVALDVDGVAGQAFRLYQAAFNREPDLPGLGLWIGKLDQGATLASVARSFIASAEFTTLMGSATPSDEAFVAAMYHNVLHRDPDAPGLQFWIDKLHDGMARETVLTGFSESAENQAALVGVTAGGIEYVPFG